MRHTDTKSMRRFTDTVGSRVQVLEDDHLITNTDPVTTAASGWRMQHATGQTKLGEHRD